MNRDWAKIRAKMRLAVLVAAALLAAAAAAAGAADAPRRIRLAPFPTPDEIQALRDRAETNGGRLPRVRDDEAEAARTEFPRFREEVPRVRFMDTHQPEEADPSESGGVDDTPYNWWPQWAEELRGAAVK